MDADDRGYSFDDEENAFDPLENMVFDESSEQAGEEGYVSSVLEDGQYNMPNPDAQSRRVKGQAVSFANHDTAEERIDALFDEMPTYQRVLYGIIGMCTHPVAAEEIERQIRQLKGYTHTVFSPLTLCDLLERAGALKEVDEEGASLSGAEREPVQVEYEGEMFWQVAPAPHVYWVQTDEGRARFDSYRPLQLIGDCFKAEPQYSEIFATVLEMCARDGGTSIKAVGDVIDDEPVLQKPKHYAMYFIDKLEHAGAVEWDGSWKVTDAGREYLDLFGEEL